MFSGAAVTGRHTPSSRLAQIRFPDVVVTDSKAPASMCKVSLASRAIDGVIISVANMGLLCETTSSLLLFIFRVWEDLNSESGVWCHSPIFHQNIWNFAFPWNIAAFILKVSQNERSSSVHISFLNSMVGGEISLYQKEIRLMNILFSNRINAE